MSFPKITIFRLCSWNYDTKLLHADAFRRHDSRSNYCLSLGCTLITFVIYIIYAKIILLLYLLVTDRHTECIQWDIINVDQDNQLKTARERDIICGCIETITQLHSHLITYCLPINYQLRLIQYNNTTANIPPG